MSIKLKMYLVVLPLLNGLASAQSDSLALSSAVTTPGGPASLNLSLTSPTGSEPTSAQWTYVYTPSDIVGITVNPGPALTAAGKSVSCSGSAGSYICVAFGPNTNAILNGVVATATLTTSATLSSTSIEIGNSLGASTSGGPLSISATGGTISATAGPTLGALSCSPASLTAPGTFSCRVTLNGPVPAGTSAAVSLTSNDAVVSVPSYLSVSAGSSTAAFNASASAVTVTHTVVVTATLGGISKTASLTVLPPPRLSTFTCNASSQTFRRLHHLHGRLD